MSESKCRAAVAVLALVVAFALSWPSWAQDNVEQDRGVICDTVEQLEQFAAFNGDDATAVNAVNDIYHTHACAILVVAVVKGKKVKDISAGGQVLELREILVIGWFDGKRWRELNPFVQYALYPTGEEGASLPMTFVGGATSEPMFAKTFGGNGARRAAVAIGRCAPPLSIRLILIGSRGVLCSMQASSNLV